jgi:hypothetical protein
MVTSASRMSAPVRLSEEAALLCLCARRCVQSAGVKVRPETGAATVNWDHLLAIASRHGVAELLVAPLRDSGLPVPARILGQLEAHQIEVTGLNLNRTTQLVELLALLTRHNILALTYKGPILAAATYGHLGRRLSNDLDILVDRADLSRACELMLADGYLLLPRRRFRAGSLLRGLYRGAGRDETLLPGHASRVSVDVHVAFAHWTLGMHLRASELLDRGVTEDLAGHPVKTLCPEDLLLVLAIHGMMHGWGFLRFVSDIDAVAERVTDWQAVVDRAASARMLRPLRVAVLLAYRLLHTALPQSIVEESERDMDAKVIAEDVIARLFEPASTVRAEMGMRDPWFLPFHERRVDRLRFHARALIYEWLLKWPWDAWLGRRNQSRDASR